MFGRSLVSAHQARILEERARLMRFSPTRSEEWLWRSLAGSKTGFGFRRQLVIGQFIVDFACTKVRLAVEVDGPYHEGNKRLDALRDHTLQELGWGVLRIEEHLVFKDLDAVVSIITRACAARSR
jgi:very-short-patch-repair endonuclease